MKALLMFFLIPLVALLAQAAPAPASATVSWTKSTDANVTAYRVYYGLSPRHYIQPFGTGTMTTASTYTQLGLQKGVAYYFSVTSIDSSTGVESAYSNEVIKIVQ